MTCGGDVAEAYAAAAGLLRAATSVHVCAHVDPDGDAVGSVLGLTLALRQIGVDAVPLLAGGGGAPAMYRFLPAAAQYRDGSTATAADVLVALDTPTVERLGDAQHLATAAGAVIVIDHHPDNRCFGSVNVHDPSAAAAGQMIWRLLPLLGVAPDSDIATCLYAALVTDTGRFQYSNTDAATMRDAAQMLEAGARARDIVANVYENHSAGLLELVGRTLTRLALENRGRVAWSWIDDDDLAVTSVRAEGTENLIDVIRQLGGVDAVFLIKVRSTECRVSLRAKTDVDVGAVARSFGGGGHAAAAGFTFVGDRDALLPELLARLPGGSGSDEASGPGAAHAG